ARMSPSLLNLSYLIASICFILALQGLSSPKHARRGIIVGAVGMAVAVGATLFHHQIVTYSCISPDLVVASLLGAAISRIPMTKMPERIAFSHAFGGLAAALVGVTEYHKLRGLFGEFVAPAPGDAGHEITRLTMGALGFEVFLGSLTFTGSIMAFGKLQG